MWPLLGTFTPPHRQGAAVPLPALPCSPTPSPRCVKDLEPAVRPGGAHVSPASSSFSWESWPRNPEPGSRAVLDRVGADKPSALLRLVGAEGDHQETEAKPFPLVVDENETGSGLCPRGCPPAPHPGRPLWRGDMGAEIRLQRGHLCVKIKGKRVLSLTPG